MKREGDETDVSKEVGSISQSICLSMSSRSFTRRTEGKKLSKK